MTPQTPALPQIDPRLLETFTAQPVTPADYLEVTGKFLRYAAPMALVLFLSAGALNLQNVFVQSIALAVLLVSFGGLVAILVAFLSAVEKMGIYVEEYRDNNEAARLYVKQFNPHIETYIEQRGKTNTANVGNVTTNIIDSETLRVLNRQYSVAQVILELINGAGGGRKPKPFSYERVRAALTERGIGQVEHEDWAQAIALLEAGKVIDNGAAPTAWKVVKLGESASAGLDEAMRGKGLQKFTQNGAVTWSAEQ